MKTKQFQAIRIIHKPSGLFAEDITGKTLKDRRDNALKTLKSKVVIGFDLSDVRIEVFSIYG